MSGSGSGSGRTGPLGATWTDPARGRWRRQRNWGCRVQHGSTQGMRTITLENKRLRVSFLADKGADLIEFLYKPEDLDLAWLTADGVRDPRGYVSTSPDLSATFHDYYLGGWQEMFPNAGVPAERWGAQFGQHGEVANLPWDDEIITDTAGEIAVRLGVRTQKTPFIVERTVRLRDGEPALSIDGSVINDSPVPLEAMWGHHVTFGRPFLHPGCRIRLPEGVRLFLHPRDTDTGHWLRHDTDGSWPYWPAATGAPADADGMADLSVLPTPGTPSEMCYLTGFGADAWYAVESDRHGIGVRVTWDANRFPFLWYWQEYGATQGYPWYGRHYNIGLEPCTSWSPNGLPGAVENGTALTLGPGERKTGWLRAEVYRLTSN